MAVRSRPLFFRTSLPSGATTIVYTVPAGRTAIVKLFVAHNRTATARDVFLGVRSSAGTEVLLARNSALASNGRLEVPADVVLGPGDHLVAGLGSETNSTGVGTFASGSLLLGAPE